jgi:hypothetical protein
MQVCSLNNVCVLAFFDLTKQNALNVETFTLNFWQVLRSLVADYQSFIFLSALRHLSLSLD